jgi:serine kinase of HPr protein (carbohydrate metabolism regulator)
MPEDSGADETIHATCLVVGEAGLLIRGPSGSGKSTSAREIVAAARQAGLFARLVSDDRTRIGMRHGRLVAGAVEAIAGRIEARGVGILHVPFEARAVVRLVLDLSSYEPPRLPQGEDAVVTLCGVMVPRLLQRSGATSAGLVLGRLSCAQGAFVTV